MLNHNKPIADLINGYARTIENAELLKIAKERSKERGRAIKVDLDDL